jgi:hypothetical protein
MQHSRSAKPDPFARELSCRSLPSLDAHRCMVAVDSDRAMIGEFIGVGQAPGSCPHPVVGGQNPRDFVRDLLILRCGFQSPATNPPILALTNPCQNATCAPPAATTNRSIVASFAFQGPRRGRSNSVQAGQHISPSPPDLPMIVWPSSRSWPDPSAPLAESLKVL